ncbi:hypothetical protein CHS0354_041992 [Potamilus streckersoni]|uniref:Uncharacterized protein n=1 Tax=Potamilus streckersoni TaxID=2493646 RepID=A0AAE0TAM7_9BIVA|nr:hypothetical protein CHS0354_041992 [Potamilus streckersoni]
MAAKVYIFNSLGLYLVLSYIATLLKSVSTAVATEINAGQSNEDLFKHNVKFYQPAYLSCSHPKSTQVQAWILPTGEVIKYPFKGHYSERVSIFDHGQLLSVRKTDNDDFGLYICIVMVSNRGLMTIKHGVNVDGPYYDPKQAENYRRNAIIGGIAAGIILVLSIMLWIISDNCRKGRDKERSTMNLSLEGDPEPRMNCGLDCEDIVIGVGTIDGGRTKDDLAGLYETVEEKTNNQYASAKTTTINTEIVHEIIVSADHCTIEALSEIRSNTQELDLTSGKQTDLQSETTAEGEVDVQEDKQDESGNNGNFQCEITGGNEEAILPEVMILKDNGVTEMDDLIFSPQEAEPDLEEKKDQLILLKESTILNNPTYPVSIVSSGVDKRDDIQGLLSLEHTEVEMKETSKGPSSRHGSNHKENIIIQDGKVIIQMNAESTEDKIQKTFGIENITSDIFKSNGEIEMNAAEDTRDEGDNYTLSVSMSNENLETSTATLGSSGLKERLISEWPLKTAPGYTEDQGYFGLLASADIYNEQTTE